MKKFGRLLAVAAVVCAVGMVQTARAELGFDVGGKLWFVTFADPVAVMFDGAGNRYELQQDPFVLIGPKLQWTTPKFPLWVSGMVLVGISEGSVDVSDRFGNELDAHGSYDFTLADSELVVGYSFSWIDVGVGLRHTLWKISNMEVTVSGSPVENSGGESDLTIYGPMVYAGGGNTFGNLPFGWYLGGSYMFLDLGESKEGEHYNIETGVFYSKNRFSATGGLRLKGFPKANDAETEGNMTQVGLALSASYKF